MAVRQPGHLQKQQPQRRQQYQEPEDGTVSRYCGYNTDGDAAFEQLFVETAVGVKDIEVLIGRNRYGRKITEALIEYAKLRVEVEKDYAKALEKLADFDFPILEPVMKKALADHGGYDKTYRERAEAHLSNVLNQIQKETREFAKSQRNFARRVESSVMEPFIKSFKSQVGTKLKHKTRLYHAAQKIESTSKKLVELKQDLCKHREREISAAASVEVNPQDGRAKEGLDKTRHTMQACEGKIAELQRLLDCLRSEFKEGIRAAAQDIHEAEVVRIGLTYQKLDELCAMMRDQCNVANHVHTYHHMLIARSICSLPRMSWLGWPKETWRLSWMTLSASTLVVRSSFQTSNMLLNLTTYFVIKYS